MKNGNEQAFPTPETISSLGSKGLTKRELFAFMAMQGLVANRSSMKYAIVDVAKDAIAAADALLKELQKEEV